MCMAALVNLVGGRTVGLCFGERPLVRGGWSLVSARRGCQPPPIILAACLQAPSRPGSELSPGQTLTVQTAHPRIPYDPARGASQARVKDDSVCFETDGDLLPQLLPLLLVAPASLWEGGMGAPRCYWGMHRGACKSILGGLFQVKLLRQHPRTTRPSRSSATDWRRFHSAKWAAFGVRKPILYRTPIPLWLYMPLSTAMIMGGSERSSSFAFTDAAALGCSRSVSARW